MAIRKAKEPNYFQLLSQMTLRSREAAQMLLELLTDYTNVPAKVEAIHDVEHRADELLHSFCEQVNAAFITPIDREDLISIANCIDSITDSVEDCGIDFHIYNVITLEKAAEPMCRLALDAVCALHEAVEAFETFKDADKLSEKIIEVNRVEAQGDVLYKNALRALYTAPSPSPLHVMKWEHIFGSLEEILDGCEDVADLLSLYAIKNR